MSTVELDDQLVEAATEVAYQTAIGMVTGGFSDGYRWKDLDRVDRERNIATTRAAIAHYLANRSRQERLRESATLLVDLSMEQCRILDPALADWCPKELRDIADQLDAAVAAEAALAELDAQVEELAKALHLARIVSGATLTCDWDECDEVFQRWRRAEARDLLKTFAITRREA